MALYLTKFARTHRSRRSPGAWPPSPRPTALRNSSRYLGVYTAMPCGCVLMAYLGLSIWDGPPRTLRFQIDAWQNQSWGFHDVARQRVRCEVAVASDGSRMNRCEHESFRYYFLRGGQGMLRTLYLRPGNAAFQIDDAARTVHGGPCSCTWEPLTALPDDHECSQTAAARLPDGKRRSGSNRRPRCRALSLRR